MKRELLFWDMEWTYADEPDSNHREAGVIKSQIRYFVKTTSPIAKLIRGMEDGDKLEYLSQNNLSHMKVKCYAA